MAILTDWKAYWESKSSPDVSDFEFDRGHALCDRRLEALSTFEMLAFVQPAHDEVVFDAGCGTGGNIALLSSHVGRIVGMDYAASATTRCRKRLCESAILNADLVRGSVTHLPLSDDSVDKVLCFSVFHYLSDAEINLALTEFGRVLRSGGEVLLHVKNLSSLYIATLAAAKRLKAVFGKPVREDASSAESVGRCPSKLRGSEVSFF